MDAGEATSCGVCRIVIVIHLYLFRVTDVCSMYMALLCSGVLKDKPAEEGFPPLLVLRVVSFFLSFSAVFCGIRSTFPVDERMRVELSRERVSSLLQTNKRTDLRSLLVRQTLSDIFLLSSSISIVLCAHLHCTHHAHANEETVIHY